MKIATLTLFSLLTASAGFAATLNVPGTYATIQACLNAAQPGDTCLVAAGTYAGATVSRSGSAGKRITIQADTSGSQPILTGSINVGTNSYITVQGFYFNGASVSGSRGATYIEIKGNTFNNTSQGGITSLHADNVLIDGNTFTSALKADMINQWGWYWVIRNNIAHNIDDTNDVHLDFWQTYCGGGFVPGAYTLFENNLVTGVTGPNTHFFQWNNATCTTE